MSNIKRANDILSDDPSLRELLWDVVNELGDSFNGTPKDLHECISRAAYLQEQADKSTSDGKLNNVDWVDWKSWSEGFVAGFGWSVETISNLFVKACENETQYRRGMRFRQDELLKQ